ncbi:MAG: ATP-binding protein [Calditrichaceae bacterium]
MKEYPSESPQKNKYLSYLPDFRLGIFKKFLLSFLVIAILPLLIFGFFTLFTMNSLKSDIYEQVLQAIDQKTQESMELQAVLTATMVQKFLKQCEHDLLAFKDVIPTETNYHYFNNQHKSEIWVRGGTNEYPSEERVLIPLYKEIAIIDANGNEKLKIQDNILLPKKSLKNVRNPKNTTYLCETYFRETAELPENEIYVSHVTGFYVSRKEQLQSAATIEEAVEGKKYDGVVRFAAPLYDYGEFRGIVMLALDHRHLMEFTQHILPNQKSTTVFPVYGSGDYAFMFDDEGWIITHPKFWDIRGVNENGKWVPPYRADSPPEAVAEGRIPFNLDEAGFIHQGYPYVAGQVREGVSGAVVTTNVGGIKKVMAYAPIFYNKGDYKKSGIFGAITIGAEIGRFQHPALSIANDFSRIILFIRNNIVWFIIITFAFAGISSWFISRSFSRPLLKITDAAGRLADGHLDEVINIQRRDEIGVLGMVFNFMAYELKKSKSELLNSMKTLEISKNETENYARDLEYQVKIFKTIQKISNILGTTFDINKILRLILQNSVESMGFDRAILYLIDDSGTYLECRETFGFSDEQEHLARRSKYNLHRFDCIETRVVKTGRIVRVDDFKVYPEATPLDKKIRKLGKSNSFVFIPLKIKETIIGILGADKLFTKEIISDLDINSLQILANQAARVIENTQLYREIIQQRNFVEDVLRYMLNGVITTDKNGKITSINRSAIHILKAEREEIIGRTVWQVFKNHQYVIDEVQKSIKSKGFYHGYNLELYTAEGIRFVMVNVSVLHNSTGDSTGVIVILQDTTDKKHIDDHLKRIDRLASLGRFAAGIAHEIRNPLTGISLFLDDLHDKISNQPEITKVVEQALTEVERLENLINELLDYAAPSKGQLALKDINKLIDTTLRFVDKQCKNAEIIVKTRLKPDVPVIMMDSEKIRQALLNIIINSIQVMPQGGKLTVSTSCSDDGRLGNSYVGIESNDKEKTWIEIIIEDTGPGIPVSDLDKIFDPFYTKKSGGTGLGLSITHSIISEHSGKIEVRSIEGKGTIFAIYLPALSQPVHA